MAWTPTLFISLTSFYDGLDRMLCLWNPPSHLAISTARLFESSQARSISSTSLASSFTFYPPTFVLCTITLVSDFLAVLLHHVLITKYLLNSARSSIRYQGTTFICETTPGVRGWNDYVHLSPEESRDYLVNMFFWFFEARSGSIDAPLAIWLNGGPGASPVASAVSENGPCTVLADSNTTELSLWFSYDTLSNGTLNTLSTALLPTMSDFSVSGFPKQNNTFFVGTFPSLESGNTANTTTNSALTVWEFLQVWLEGVPFYENYGNTISIWGASYGGHWVTGSLALPDSSKVKKNRIATGTLKEAFPIKADTVGIIDGQIDFSILAGSYPDMAHNNTYGFGAITEDEFISTNLTTYEALIQESHGYCALYVEYVYLISGHDAFDIGHTTPDPTPTKYELGYLNQHWVQSALGVPVNFIYQNMVVYNANSTTFLFHSLIQAIISVAYRDIISYVMVTGDNWRYSIIRGGFLETLGSLLDRGVRVTLMYGDRDYICNLAKEQVSPSNQHPLSNSNKQVTPTSPQTTTYNGGVVRQHGNLSFLRVFDATHQVSSSQPETAYRIFTRAMFHKDIVTDNISLPNNSAYSTTGSSSSFQNKNTMPDDPPKICYTYMPTTTCTTDQLARLQNGTAIVEDWVVMGYLEDEGMVYY
ncbi:uncharacterized protein PAC_01614 [Phialocephala subalpina]|uniref:Uncharacterized protein n=1 Tax=Phialocephala subalpina TaxID=576137 RepID=A0A1L7WG43_9HELO|nr:uncharacterized protein PAC_01614 [Phialocephala subalpina]